MSMIIVGLVRNAPQARDLVHALEEDGFRPDGIDVSRAIVAELLARGVPEKEAQHYAEGARRGGVLVCVRAKNEDEAAEAAAVMREHGAVDIDACAADWESAGQQHQPQSGEEYALVFGEYPAAPGRIYRDPRSA